MDPQQGHHPASLDELEERFRALALQLEELRRDIAEARAHPMAQEPSDQRTAAPEIAAFEQPAPAARDASAPVQALSPQPSPSAWELGRAGRRGASSAPGASMQPAVKVAGQRSAPSGWNAGGLTPPELRGWNAGGSPAKVVSRPLRSWSFADLEKRLAGRLLAVTGGIALVIAAVFFLSLAFSRGWIGPEARVLLGLGIGGASIALSWWLFDHRQPIVAHVLVATGLAIVTLALFAATSLYGLVPVSVALIGSLVAGLVAAAIAIRNESQVVAGLGLLSTLAAPPVLGAATDLTAVAFVAVVLVATTAVSLWRGWRWLPSAAFLLAAPQVWTWIESNPPASVALLASFVFWALNATAASGDVLRRGGSSRESGANVLLLAASALLVASGFRILDLDLEYARGAFLLVVATAHAALAAVFLRRNGENDIFGLLAAGTGVAALSLAIPTQLGAASGPVAWALEAAVLTWVAGTRQHRPSLAAGAVLASAAFVHVLEIEYPTFSLAGASRGSSAVVAIFVTAAFAVCATLSRDRRVGAIYGSAAFVVLARAASTELAGAALAAGLAGLALGALVVDLHLVPRLGSWVVRRNLATTAPQGAPSEAGPAIDLAPAAARARPLGDAAFRLERAAAWTAGTIGLFGLAVTYPMITVASDGPLGAIPFVNTSGLVLVIVASALIAAGLLVQRRIGFGEPLLFGVSGAALILAAGGPAQLVLPALLVWWAALAGMLSILARSTDYGLRVNVATATSGVILLVTGANILDRFIPPAHLAIPQLLSAPRPPLEHGPVGLLLILSVMGAFSAAVLLLGRALPRRPADASVIAAALGAWYGASVMVVGAFELQATPAARDLPTIAQVALSVFWLSIGAAVLVIGLVRRITRAREAGLLVLAVATAKVFLVDLSSVDVAYRVVSFAALGVLLLGSAYLFTRFSTPAHDPAPPDLAAGEGADAGVQSGG